MLSTSHYVNNEILSPYLSYHWEVLSPNPIPWCPAPGNHFPLSASVSLTTLDFSHKWNHVVFVFCNWLISLSIMSYGIIHVKVEVLVTQSYLTLCDLTDNEGPGFISFRIDWFDLLAVQGPLKSLLQEHSSKASILWCSAFFTVQLSHPYMTTGKT